MIRKTKKKQEKSNPKKQQTHPSFAFWELQNVLKKSVWAESDS